MPPQPSPGEPGRHVQHVVTLVITGLLRELTEAGVLDADGLLWVRARLARPGEMLDCPERSLLMLDVDERLAAAFDCELADVPDAPACPDDLSGLGGPGVG